MHIQVNAERLKIAFESKDEFLKESNASDKVKDIISNWHLFSDFPIKDETKALLTRTEYFVLCKFEEYFNQNQNTNEEESNYNVISLD